jgi:hypothetical protein
MIRILESADRDGTFSFKALPFGAVDELAPLFEFETSGWSMYPALKRRDRIELAPVRCLDAGDLIVFRENGFLVCHRVTAIDGDGLVRAQSDRGLAGEPGDSVPIGNVVGKVTAVVRGGRRFEPSRIARHPDVIGRAWIAMNRRAERLATVTRTAVINLCVRVTRQVWVHALCTRLLARHITWSIVPRRFGDQEILVVARLAGRCVGTLNRRSGECWVHPLLKELGIEARLSQGGCR